MSTQGALAGILERKRKQQQIGSHAVKEGGELSQHELFHSIGGSTVQNLLDKNTKTSVKKLRKLGLLVPGVSLEDLKSSFQEYLKEEKRIISDGKGSDSEDGEEENIEKTIEPATKAYESLVLSLAHSHRELGVAVEEEHKELQKNITLEDREAENVRDRKRTQETPKNPLEKKHKKGAKQQPSKASSQEDTQGFGQDDVQQQDGFKDHIEYPVDQLHGESINKNRKHCQPVDEPFQVWQKTNGASMEVSHHAHFPKGISTTLNDYGVRQRVASRWNAVYEKEDKHVFGDFQSKRQAVLFGILNAYMDVTYPLLKYPHSLEETARDEITDASLLHIINHITTCAEKIKKNNEKLEKNKDAGANYQDQGFVRPKVLILAPYRHHAKCIIDRLLELAIQETRTDTIKNKSRFLEEFGIDRDEDSMTEREKMALSLKPKQHRALFDGNCDDHFRIGIKFTRGSIRLYTDFYDSDILVASPLALSTKLEEVPKDEPHPLDFLSSIEIAIVHRADVLLMQNWQHVIKIFDSLNTIPRDQHDTDIMRIRDWYIAGKGALYRQNIICGSFESPEIKSLVSKSCSSHSGIARWKLHHKGVLQSIAPRLRHMFTRFDNVAEVSNPKEEIDARFEYFKSHLWPTIREASHLGGQLLYIPSYFDFVKVRNYLRKEAASFVALSEYSDPKDMARARAYFADKRRRVLIYTERAQFYNRHRIRGINDMYFYQLPEHPQFYAELGNFVEEATSADGATTISTIQVAFGRFDILRLERIVGTARAKKMLGSKHSQENRDTFVFC